jgi:ribosomal protein S18 acetylase RimI-like enzyme
LGETILSSDSRGFEEFVMTTTTQIIRAAKRADAAGIADVHDAAWRESYRGIIKGAVLETMIEARGPLWWERMIGSGNAMLVLDFAGQVAGYVTFGSSRNRSERFPGQIYELYLKPEFQGIGFGRKLFQAARRALTNSPVQCPVAVWALSANERAIGFYQRMGGQDIGRRSERIGPDIYETTGFGFG